MSAPVIGGHWQEELGELRPGWNGHDGKEITHRAVLTVENFATVPTSEGGIQLEIHQDGFDIEINIRPDGRIASALIAREQP